MQPLLNFLQSRDDVRIIGPHKATDRAPTISIKPLKKNLDQVYETLTEHKLMLGKGDFYAVRPLFDMNIPNPPGVIRLSFLHYTSTDEIEQLIKGLKAAL
jgi:selenocysteine lyase/cysteine desulfurase